jgi:hypothetical protein
VFTLIGLNLWYAVVMSVGLTTYIGPLIKIAVTDDFNIDDFCFETLDEKFLNPDSWLKDCLEEEDYLRYKEWLPDTRMENSDKYWFLLPNYVDWCNRYSLQLHSESDVTLGPIWNPDIPNILAGFLTDTASVRELIPLPHEVVWGVYNYWSYLEYPSAIPRKSKEVHVC